MALSSVPRAIRSIHFIQNRNRKPVNDEERQLASRLEAAGITHEYEPTQIVIESSTFEPTGDDDCRCTLRTSRRCITPDFRIEHHNQLIYLELKHKHAKRCIGHLRMVSQAKSEIDGIILMLVTPKTIHTDLPTPTMVDLLNELNFNPTDWTIHELVPRVA